MSVVAVRVTETGYTMCADSIMVYGWTQRKGDDIAKPKIVEVNGVVLGSVGLCSESVLLSVFLKTHKPESSIGGIAEMMAEFSVWKKSRTDRVVADDCVYFFGLEDKVYKFSNWCIREVPTYDAIGAGQDFALAVMAAGGTPKKGVEMAIELSPFCEAPVYTIKKRFKKCSSQQQSRGLTSRRTR